MDKIILYLALGGFIYLGAARLLNYLILLFLNKKEVSLDSNGNKIKEEIRDLSKQLEDNKRPIAPNLNKDEVEKEWNDK